ncbi:gluconate 2-dehydrogenase subunit 3 family protein [Bombella apis]|uniref:gluconate 2-dehydrogenase subunit 3 family protein n=1 Tax=Bombella apis TaxID=1785988 RepID=UPI0024A9D779|nr:gluconate 2-dehydrogenase subunit 3 family protein [Bombella apis]
MTRTLPAFLQSDHISSRTRTALLERMEQEQGQRKHLSPEAFQLLELVCDDILPQAPLLGELHLNLAVMIDQALAGPGDGWRFADLPTDMAAWEDGLASLELYARGLFGQDYASLDTDQRGTLLDRAFDGSLPVNAQAPFSASQMKLWSGDLRNQIVAVFLAHPIAQERLGISSSLTGGDKEIQGFSTESLTKKEAFEPENERRFSKMG